MSSASCQRAGSSRCGMHRVLARTRAPRDAKPARCRLTIASADKDIYKGDHPAKVDDSKYLSMRAEAEAPFRTFRLFLLGFFAISAGIATLFSIPAIIGSVGHAPNAKPLDETAQSLAINLASLGTILFFLKRDVEARNKQIRRMGREESLAMCRVELASGKGVKLGRLRSFCRPVVFCGTVEQVRAAMEAAEPYKDELLRRGVFLVPITLEGDMRADLPPLDKAEEGETKWQGRAVRAEDWRGWFRSQAADANKTLDNGLYVGLRLDGRVRASGMGCPPWGIFAKQLAPMEGMWAGLFDGMDGRVGG